MQPAYEREPYLTEIEVEVVEVGTRGTRPFAILSDTILYPEGGGQPADRGEISGAGVVDVQRDGERIRHDLAAPVAPGPARVRLDWVRRFDHMQQHTAQHLLTALAHDRFGWPTTAFHLGPEVSDIELDVPVPGREALDALEEAAAAEVRAARAVSARRVAPEALASLPGLRTRGLPEGHRGEVRLVEIAGIDLNTCGGTHLASTAEIEAIQLLGTESMRGGTRLCFVAGRRARRRGAANEARNAELRALLGVPEEEFPAAVSSRLEQLRDGERRARSLEAELASTIAAGLARRAEGVVLAHFAEKEASFLAAVARALTNQAGEGLALLTAGSGSEGPFVLAAAAGFDGDLLALGRAAAAVLEGRGGGAGRIFQGKGSALGARETALERLRGMVLGGEAGADGEPQA